MALSNDMSIVIINGEKFYMTNDKLQAGAILASFVPRLQYMSTTAMLHLLRITSKMLGELGVQKRQIKDIGRIIDRYTEREDPWTEVLGTECESPQIRMDLMNIICEFVLRTDGCGKLHGFHLVATSNSDGGKIVTGVLNVNPESKPVNFK